MMSSAHGTIAAAHAAAARIASIRDRLKRRRPQADVGGAVAIASSPRSSSDANPALGGDGDVIQVPAGSLLRQRRPVASRLHSGSGENASQDAMAEIHRLITSVSHKETANRRVGSEISSLLSTASVKEQSVAHKFRSGEGVMQEFCTHTTAKDCKQATRSNQPCNKIHFTRIIKPHTDVRLGDCNFLNYCHRPACKFAHYVVDARDDGKTRREAAASTRPGGQQLAQRILVKTQVDEADLRTYPAQWIQCDVRHLDISVLGKFSVIMADPPWDIRMDLPYGTLPDDAMKRLPVATLSDNGYIFLWVTGRALELGRECLETWGYKRVDELIWVKTNQLQKLVRTGRTGHWMNHAKEHCIIGAKGDTSRLFNRGLDCDVLVAEVRDTSHKPDEIYGLIERLSPGTRKLEIFGRQHNVQKNWLTLGNQLEGVHLVNPEVIARFTARYPSEDPNVTQHLLLTGQPPPHGKDLA